MIRLINIVAIALFIIMLIILFKFDLVCEVTINGEKCPAMVMIPTPAEWCAL